MNRTRYAALLIAAVMAAGAAHAQDQTSDGAAAGDAAAATGATVEAAPVRADTSCGVANCLSLQVSPDGVAALRRGGDLTAFADALTVSVEGDAPPLFLVAARYDRGRLTQYAASPWLQPLPGPAMAVDGAAEIVAKAAAPRFGRQVRLVPASEDQPVWTTPISAASFLVESPRAYLIGAPASAPVDEAAAPAGLAERSNEGSVLLIAVAPAAASLRGPDMTHTVGMIVPLQYTD